MRPSRQKHRTKTPPTVPSSSRPGRPRIIQTPAEFDAKVDSYIEHCRSDKSPITWTGLALALGFSSRQALNDYAEYPGFSNSVERAKLLVEQAYEERLHSSTPVGAIFALKNMGWSDRQEIESRSLVANIDLTRLTNEQLLRIQRGENPLQVIAEAQLLPAKNDGAGS